MKVFALFLALLALTTTSALIVRPGISFGFSDELVENLKNEVLPKVIEKGAGVTLPSFSHTVKLWIIKETLTVSNAKIESLSVDFANSTIDVVSDNVGMITLKGINFNISFDYAVSGLLHMNSTGSFNLSDTTLQVKYTLGRNKEAPEVLVYEKDGLAVILGDYDVDLNGGFIAKVITFLANKLEFLVKPVVDIAVRTFGASAVDKLLESVEEHITMSYDITPEMGINYGIVTDPVLNSSYFQVQLDGTFFEVKNRDAPVPVAAAVPLPNFNTSGAQLQFYLSAYTLDTGLYTLTDTGAMKFTVTPKMIPPSVPFKLDTTQINGIIPGFVEAYGSNVPMKLEGEVIDPSGAVTLTPGSENIDVDMNVRMSFVVETKDGDSDALDFNAHVNFGLGMKVSKGKIFPTVNVAVLNDFDLNSTHLKNFNSTEAEAHLNVMLMLIKGVAGEELSKGIKLPGFDGIELTDTEIAFNDGYVGIETTPDFSGFAKIVADTFWSKTAVSLEDLKEI